MLKPVSFHLLALYKESLHPINLHKLAWVFLTYFNGLLCEQDLWDTGMSAVKWIFSFLVQLYGMMMQFPVLLTVLLIGWRAYLLWSPWVAVGSFSWPQILQMFLWTSAIILLRILAGILCQASVIKLFSTCLSPYEACYEGLLAVGHHCLDRYIFNLYFQIITFFFFLSEVFFFIKNQLHWEMMSRKISLP